MKYAVCLGAAAGSRSRTNVPAMVSTTACFGGVCARATDRNEPQRPQSTQRAIFLSDLGDLSGSIFSRLLSVHGTVDDLPCVPDIVQARDDRDRQRHPDADVDD